MIVMILKLLPLGTEVTLRGIRSLTYTRASLPTFTGN